MDTDTESTGFHYKDEWYFRRLNDAGTVRVRYPDANAPQGFRLFDIDADSWASIMASVSFRGDTAESFALAQGFHSEVRREVIPDPHFTPHIV